MKHLLFVLAVLVTWEYRTIGKCRHYSDYAEDTIPCEEFKWKKHHRRFFTFQEARAFKAHAPKDKTRNWKFMDKYSEWEFRL
jgi:hypothetical protein